MNTITCQCEEVFISYKEFIQHKQFCDFNTGTTTDGTEDV